MIMTNNHTFYIFFFPERMHVFHVIETNSYCAAYIFFFTKKKCMRDFFNLKNVQDSEIRTIIILKVYTYLFIFICKYKNRSKT